MRTTCAVMALLAAALLSGCDRSQAKKDAVAALLKSCVAPAKVSIQLGGWNEHVAIECEVKPSEFGSRRLD